MNDWELLPFTFKRYVHDGRLDDTLFVLYTQYKCSFFFNPLFKDWTFLQPIPFGRGYIVVDVLPPTCDNVQ